MSFLRRPSFELATRPSAEVGGRRVRALAKLEQRGLGIRGSSYVVVIEIEPLEALVIVDVRQRERRSGIAGRLRRRVTVE